MGQCMCDNSEKNSGTGCVTPKWQNGPTREISITFLTVTIK